MLLRLGCTPTAWAHPSRRVTLRHATDPCQVTTVQSPSRWNCVGEPACPPLGPWYVPLALRAWRTYAVWVGVGGLLSVGVTACGGGDPLDADEDDRTYEVQVAKASFPKHQVLAKKSDLEITVKNTDSETIPNIAVTVDGFYTRLKDPDLFDPRRPVFSINGVRKQIGNYPEIKLDAPDGGETFFVNTWALGELKPDAKTTFRWRVTAMRPGPYKLTYKVSAGLHGKGLAEDVGGSQPSGTFAGTISDEVPYNRVAADGRTVISSSDRR